MNPTHYRNRWLKQLRRYERTGERLIRKRFRDIASKIPLNELTPARYQDVIFVSIGLEDIRSLFVDLYVAVGVSHGNKVREAIHREIKGNDDEFEKDIEAAVISLLSTTIMGVMISSMRRNFAIYLYSYLQTKINQGVPFGDAVDMLGKLIASRNFYSWQMKRIAKTESVSAANLGGHVASSTSGVRMRKMWISATDDRTRRVPRDSFDHVEMHEKIVGIDDHFSVPKRSGGFENIKFPGDPTASSGNRINCRCTAGYIPVRDRNGDPVFTDSRPSARVVL